jgi:hypothetical protein
MRHDWEGEIHTLTVHSMLPPEEWLGDDPEFDFDIDHPASCKRTEEDWGNGITIVSWDCEVQTQGVDDGLAFSLSYSGTPVTEPGIYKIRGWGTKYWTECGDEYDGGVVIVDDTGTQTEASSA